MPKKLGKVETRIGISGWKYKPWRSVFYPEGLPQRCELDYASRQFNSIEINSSFYSLQRPHSYKRWYEETPKDFRFSIKGNRYITHIRRLKNVRPLLANFFGSGVLHLKEKLGPILWQLPPSFRYDEDNLETFFRELPTSWRDVKDLVSEADRIDPDLPRVKSGVMFRHAIEVRHDSFENPDFVSLARRYNVAIVFADTAGKWPYMEDITSDFIYLRLHGDIELYKSGYDESSLRWWANRIRIWQSGKEPRDAQTLSFDSPQRRNRNAFIYFDNDVKVRAPFDANRLSELVALKSKRVIERL